MILFLDLGTHKTGYCLGDGLSVPLCGTVRLTGPADLGGLLTGLETALSDLSVHGQIEVVGYESPITLRRDSLASKRSLYSLGAFVEWWALKQSAKCFESSPQALKKELTGKHNASKSDMVAMAKKCGINLPHGALAEDAADAFAGWLIALRVYNKAARLKWDRRLYGSRGALL